MKKQIKMVIEIILIGLALGFLEYQMAIKDIKATKVLLIMFIFIITLKLIINLIKDISIKQDKVFIKILKILFLIINIFLLFIVVYINFINKNGNIVLENIGFILTIILLLYLIVFAIKDIIKVGKSDKVLPTNTKNGLFNFVFFCLILIPFLILLIK